MYDEHQKTILRRLWNIKCIGGKHTSRENTLRAFPKSKRDKGKTAIDELIRRNLIIPKPTTYREQIALNSRLIRDIRQIINPSEEFNDGVYEDSLKTNYSKQSFKETSGDKMVKGIQARYAYHQNLYDPNILICYLSVSGIKKRNIDLGSFHNPESLLAKTVTGIDFYFKDEAFSKADLTILGKEIVENRQPIHAIIDMLLHFGYIDQVTKKQYTRTNKKLPKPPLDVFRDLDESETIRSKHGRE